ncbi:hypothetical protein F0L17_04570 [Streptomyces sp. TRM43335]|uniref:Uncharacterized protein n=1 Tax=Streptomyces taklimakanensis TaxID=2569853 RepID=A0A6G2B810_9ACTN|nr:hypothetical protein [Streptomyces taklimakanensis]MTE18415.1 hypothetical protein [Streptomyces taklimakanensis]
MDEPMSGRTPETGPRPRTAVRPGAESGSVAEVPRPSGPGGTAPGDGPRPLGVEVTPTGHAGVDAGLRRLADADHLAVSGHLEVYEDVHRGLRDILTALDRRPGPPEPGAPHDPGS